MQPPRCGTPITWILKSKVKQNLEQTLGCSRCPLGSGGSGYLEHSDKKCLEATFWFSVKEHYN